MIKLFAQPSTSARCFPPMTLSRLYRFALYSISLECNRLTCCAILGLVLQLELNYLIESSLCLPCFLKRSNKPLLSFHLESSLSSVCIFGTASDGISLALYIFSFLLLKILGRCFFATAALTFKFTFFYNTLPITVISSSIEHGRIDIELICTFIYIN